jgi:hypothetical protein
MDLSDGVRGGTSKLMDLLRQRADCRRTLAELRADIGDQMVEIQEALGEEGVPWEAWLAEQRRLAQERGVEPLSERAVRLYLQAARFRARHAPELAAAYLQLEPSALREVAALPAAVLEQFRQEGVPTAGGRRVPLGEATTRQFAWAARHARAVLRGEPAPAPDTAPAEAPAPQPPALAPQEEFAKAMEHLLRAGPLTLEQVECLVETAVSAVTAGAPEETARTTRCLLAEAVVEASQGDPARLAEEIASTLERLRPLCDAVRSATTAALLERVKLALTRLVMAIARWAAARGHPRA